VQDAKDEDQKPSENVIPDTPKFVRPRFRNLIQATEKTTVRPINYFW